MPTASQSRRPPRAQVRRPARPLGESMLDGVLIPALIAGEEALGAARPALARLRSPRARAAIGVPLLALAVELSASRLHHDGGAAPRQGVALSAPAPYRGLIEHAARRYRLDPRLVMALIQQESRFDPRARNARSGASGLMQLSPSTARALGASDPTDPRQAIAAGCRYLRQLLERFHGDLRLALAAYNAGPSAVSRAGGVPDYPETRAYVRAVLRRYAAYRGRA